MDKMITFENSNVNCLAQETVELLEARNFSSSVTPSLYCSTRTVCGLILTMIH